MRFGRIVENRPEDAVALSIAERCADRFSIGERVVEVLFWHRVSDHASRALCCSNDGRLRRSQTRLQSRTVTRLHVAEDLLSGHRRK